MPVTDAPGHDWTDAPGQRAAALGLVVRVQDVSKSFGDFVALDHVSLDVRRGEIVAVIGPSGSGKTTLLRILIGLVACDSGAIEILGRRVVDRTPDGRATPTKDADAVRREFVGMVFQSFNLFPHRTVLENVIEGPVYVRHEARSQAVPRAKRLLDQVGLLDRSDFYPSQLSGGQQQRVAIARALAMEPELLLLDEVTSALDPELTGEVLRVILDLARAGQTMIVVTHEMGFAQKIANRVLFMDEGRIVEEGNPETVLVNPREERTSQFLSKVLHLDLT